MQTNKFISAFVQATAEKDDDEAPKMFDRSDDSTDLKQKDDPAEVRYFKCGHEVNKNLNQITDLIDEDRASHCSSDNQEGTKKKKTRTVFRYTL